MRILIAILCLSMVSCSTSKKIVGDANSLILAHKTKNQLLIDGNAHSLKKIVHPQLLYKHSNCWEEQYTEFTNPSHILDYHAIEIETVDTRIIDNIGIVHGTANFNITYKEKEMSLWLCYVEHYQWKNKQWILISRHASKDTSER